MNTTCEIVVIKGHPSIDSLVKERDGDDNYRIRVCDRRGDETLLITYTPQLANRHIADYIDRAFAEGANSVFCIEVDN